MNPKLIKYLKQLENWLLQTVTKAKANGVIFGLSGGIDSAVVAGICKKIFKTNHLAVIMHINNSTEDLTATELLVKNLKLNYLALDLKPVFHSYLKTLKLKEDNLGNLGNLKARIRMSCLYALAGEKNYLVLGTGNYVEYFLGYFTKYGDGGVDIQPLLNLLKRDVYALAKYLKIPSFVINKKPSAGLYAGQSDEKEIGITYADLDGYLANEKTLKNHELKKLKTLFNKATHKKNQPVSFKPYHQNLKTKP